MLGHLLVLIFHLFLLFFWGMSVEYLVALSAHS